MTKRVVGGLMAVLALAAAGFMASGSFDLGRAGTNPSVSLRKTKLGPVLVNSKGRTLYLFTKDRSGKSSCAGPCAQYWPPAAAAAKPTAGKGVKLSLLGVVKRSNGARQLTYGKHPLYRYAGDAKAGQTAGQGSTAFSGKWYAVSAAGKAVTRAPTTTTTTTTTGPTTTDCPYPPYC